MKPNHGAVVPATPPRLHRASKPSALIFLWVLFVAFLALPPSVRAERSRAPKPPGTSAEFTVAASNGYSLYFKSEKGTVDVIASKERPPFETISATGRIRQATTGGYVNSIYMVSGAPKDPRTIDANLGSLGRISVTFQPSGETRVSNVDLKDEARHCVGAERVVRRLGVFVGTIEFQGEGGYTAVDVPSAPGTVGTSLFRNCTTKGNHRHPRRTTRRLNFSAISNGPSIVIFSASNDRFCSPRDTTTCFYGIAGESRPPNLFVERTVRAASTERAFALNDARTLATFSPPPPFSGQATFQRDAQGSSRWTGTLSVAFPGVTVPLTGPSFEAGLRPTI